jgi:hypothetical protein
VRSKLCAAFWIVCGNVRSQLRLPADLWQLTHWLQFWQLRTWIHDICYLTIRVTVDSIRNSCDAFFLELSFFPVTPAAPSSVAGLSQSVRWPGKFQFGWNDIKPKDEWWYYSRSIEDNFEDDQFRIKWGEWPWSSMNNNQLLSFSGISQKLSGSSLPSHVPSSFW